MSEKPMNVNTNARLVSALSTPTPNLAVSFESDSVSVGANEPLDVRGIANVFAYGGGAVKCMDTPSGTPVVLEDITGVAVSVTTARLIDVRGARWITFASSSVVVFTG